MTFQLGSISSGTMRTEDLIPAFLDALDSFKLSRNERNAVRAISKKARNSHRNNYYNLTETADADLDELFDILNNQAPAGVYFGGHAGDCADYGFWIDVEFETNFDGLKVSDLAEVPKGHSGEVLHVNDHGNMTLYAYRRGRAKEIWSVV